jgi:hypothetical protein
MTEDSGCCGGRCCLCIRQDRVVVMSYTTTAGIATLNVTATTATVYHDCYCCCFLLSENTYLTTSWYEQATS